MKRSEIRGSRHSKSPYTDTVAEEDLLDRSLKDGHVLQGLMKMMKSSNYRGGGEQEYLRRDNSKQVYDESYSGSVELNSDDPGDSSSDVEESRGSSQTDVHKVHDELCDINKKLQKEHSRLKNWDHKLKKKELHLDKVGKQLSDYAASMQERIEIETLTKCSQLEKDYELKVQKLQDENSKSRKSFKIIKEANAVLKNKEAQNDSKLKVSEEKQTALQSRISNLQRKIELLNQKISDQAAEHRNVMKEKVKQVSKSISKEQCSANPSGMFYESFTLLLQWLADVHLKENVTKLLKAGRHSNTTPECSIELTNDRVLKIIIFMPNILPHASTMSLQLQLGFIQFLYWSLLHLHLTQCPQRLSHSATYRRIGEQLFQSKQVKDGLATKAFFRSPDYNIRMMSSLIILHTITQADILAQVFQAVSAELKHELSKELFLQYHAVEILRPFFKLSNKVLLGYTTDILMTLAVESIYVQQFLDEIGTVEWIQDIMITMKNSTDITLMENLSLLIQRLSKQRCIKPIFDALQVKSAITEMTRLHSCESEYLHLNLRSILLNIEHVKSQKDTKS